MLADDVLGNGQAQPGTVRTTADHGEENGFLKFCRDARTVIDDLDLGHQAMAHVADGELAHGAGAQADAAQAQLVLAADGLHRVAHDVQYRLDHLFAVDQHVRDARVIVAHQCDAALAFGLDQVAHALQYFVNVAHGQRRQLV
ncbi:hypothetical protein D3C85_878530 [compost metagenome]